MIEDISCEVFKDLIIEFLNKQNILKSFEENLIKHKELSLDKYIYCFYKKNSSMNDFILASFYWRNTKEGYCFWNTINDKYFSFLANREKAFWYD